MRNVDNRKISAKVTLPAELVMEAMEVTNIHEKTELFKFALESVVRWNKMQELKNYFGKIDLTDDINLEAQRAP